MKIEFEQFLQEKHIEECPHLLDDDLSDDFDHWITELEQDDYIKYGQEYAELVGAKTREDLLKEVFKIKNGRLNKKLC